MAYYRGDYYIGHGRGDYYKSKGGRAAMRSFGYHGYRRGDPFWGALLKGIGTVAKNLILGPSVPKPTTSQVTMNGSPLANAIQQSFLPAPGGQLMPRPPMMPKPEMIEMSRTAEPKGIRRLNDINLPADRRRRRRMNPGNVKALRRSIRRVCSFGKLVNSVKGTVRKAAQEIAPVHHRSTALARRK